MSEHCCGGAFRSRLRKELAAERAVFLLHRQQRVGKRYGKYLHVRAASRQLRKRQRIPSTAASPSVDAQRRAVSAAERVHRQIQRGMHALLRIFRKLRHAERLRFGAVVCFAVEIQKWTNHPDRIDKAHLRRTLCIRYGAAGNAVPQKSIRRVHRRAYRFRILRRTQQRIGEQRRIDAFRRPLPSAVRRQDSRLKRGDLRIRFALFRAQKQRRLLPRLNVRGLVCAAQPLGQRKTRLVADGYRRRFAQLPAQKAQTRTAIQRQASYRFIPHSFPFPKQNTVC